MDVDGEGMEGIAAEVVMGKVKKQCSGVYWCEKKSAMGGTLADAQAQRGCTDCPQVLNIDKVHT
jgi:hypothetical protein